MDVQQVRCDLADDAGGPLGGTEHLPVLSYHMAFRLYDIGGGAAVATLSLLLLTVALAVFFRRFPIET